VPPLRHAHTDRELVPASRTEAVAAAAVAFVARPSVACEASACEESATVTPANGAERQETRSTRYASITVTASRMVAVTVRRTSSRYAKPVTVTLIAL
jgi:hypothetical protein